MNEKSDATSSLSSQTAEPKGQPAPKPWEHAKSSGSAEDPLAIRFVESLSYDRRLYPHDIQGSRVHARMLAHTGLISETEHTQIIQGLDAIEKEIAEYETKNGDYGAGWPGWRMDLEDVHMCIEAALIERIGEPGRKLHTGRSRNDQVAMDLKLWIHDASCELKEKFKLVYQGFITLAESQGDIIMPSYTHLQRAQPIVLGAELMAWLAAFERCEKRVQALNDVNRDNPLGSGAIAGSTLPLDRQFVADQLPIGNPTASSMDSTASRDAAIDFVYALSMTAMTLSRWAEQWIIYCSTEFDFVKLDGRYTTGSSMMPQKQNPDMLELIRGRCGNVYGNLMALLTTCKGITIGYNRDLQEDKRHVFAAFDVIMDSLDMASRIAATASFKSDRIAAGLDRGYLDATVMAEYLVQRGVPFRTAHQIVGAMVHHCESHGFERLDQLSLTDMNKLAADAHCIDSQTILDDTVFDFLGSGNVVKRYQSAGNGGTSGFQQQLDIWRNKCLN